MSNGRFGIHGGQYIPETLMNAVIELEKAYDHYKDDPAFVKEYNDLLNEYAGRPSRLYYASHIDLTFNAKKGCYGSRCHTMLTGSGLCDQTLFAHFFSQKSLAKGII